MASSRVDEFSLVLPGMRNSLFTHYLMEGLQGGVPTRGDGLVHIFDLFRHISEEVPKRAQQHPIFKAHDMENDFPVALYLEGRKEAEAPGGPVVVHQALSPKAKLAIIDRLGDSWQRFAVYFEKMGFR